MYILKMLITSHPPLPTILFFLGISGAFGVDFSSLEEGGVWEGVETVRTGLLKHGVTAFCPTIVTSDVEYYHRVLWTSSIAPTREGEGTCFPTCLL